MIDWKPSGKETPQINEWALIWVDDKNPRYAPYGAVAQYTEDGSDGKLGALLRSKCDALGGAESA